MYTRVYEAIQEYFKENLNQEISKEEIDNLSKYEKLYYFLQWEGIYGYADTIDSIYDNF